MNIGVLLGFGSAIIVCIIYHIFRHYLFRKFIWFSLCFARYFVYISGEYALKNEKAFLFIFMPKILSPAKKLMGEKTGTLLIVDLVTGIANV